MMVVIEHETNRDRAEPRLPNVRVELLFVNL